MNIIKNKKKYEKIYKVKVQNYTFYYRPFNVKELIIISSSNEKYNDELTKEALLTHVEDFDNLDWPSKELIYKNILRISCFESDEELIKTKLKIKEEFENNAYLKIIKFIVTILPTININMLLDCNKEQLLFYMVLCESIKGKNLFETNPLKNNIPLQTQKKAIRSKQEQEELSMQVSSNDLLTKLKNHGVEPKQFIAKKDSFEE